MLNERKQARRAERRRKEIALKKRRTLEKAAPALLDACRGLLEIAELAMPDSYFIGDSRVIKAKAAIAEATKE